MFWADQFDERRVCMLGLEGSLSSSDLVNLADRLRGLAAQGVSRVVVDLRKVDHWDYRGLDRLVESVAYRRRAGGVTAFITDSRYLRNIAAAASPPDELDFYDDVVLERSGDTPSGEEVEGPAGIRASGRES